MKTGPIVPARIDFDVDGPPRAPDFGDSYHPRAGALAQAVHVFLGGNRLPARWHGTEHFTILETGFGLGNNFLATWDAWRADARRGRQLHFISIERHPPTRADLVRAHRSSPLRALADQLVASWPPLTANLHPLDFDGGQVRLLLAFGDIAQVLRELRAQVHAFYLDGFAPARNPAMWDGRVVKALARLAAPGATAATWSVARAISEHLAAAGFDVERAPGLGERREMTVAHYRPRFIPRTSIPAPRAAAPAEAVVIGAGLAGAFAARALAALGVQVTVLDRRATPATEASGNIAGLFHGTVHDDDAPHARWLRAAALLAARRFKPLIRSQAVSGAIDGLLRLDTRPDALPRMRQLVERQGLPADYVQAVQPAEASDLAGVTLAHPAWRYAQGGWLAPGELVRWLLAHPSIRFVGDAPVAALLRAGDEWRLLDGAGAERCRTGTLVLANAGDANRLIGGLGLDAWPLDSVRGQVSVLPAAACAGQRLRLPLAGSGYALSLPTGELLCGATSHHGDAEAALRAADHEFNLARLHALASTSPSVDPRQCAGRVGWRVQVPDRLPIAGAMALAASSLPPTQRLDQVRLVPRTPGLFVLTALGGRGITLAPLLGDLLAAQVCGRPWPVEASLADSADPARWVVRQARRGPGATAAGIQAPGRAQPQLL